MKRAERSEYTCIKNSLKKLSLGYGTTLTIRTDASSEYKRALDTLYTSLNFHPASVRVDKHLFDDRERVIYIYGRTFDRNGEEHPWTELYTTEEKARFEAALA
ncbi:MAG: hypothetical protein QM324_08380 [Bacteroidota bacterium]|jgi:hypothetical protein|nr:hypothetical protein [Bacteroidota bacterium]